ncbi:methyltransferase domain-containing protein [Flavobacteriaceae bacterium M23B6Z8]
MNDSYWQNRYKNENTGWDIGYVSTPIKEYIDQLTAKDIEILIPGAGNAYEAAYLFMNGFSNVHVLDFAEQPIVNFKKAYPNFPSDQLHLQDFFKHQNTYDLILEQTFFCALNPELREKYVVHMAKCLKTGGKLAGVFFDFPLTEKGPPFGGSLVEYKSLFSDLFEIKKLERCYNSIKPRMGNELFFIFEKK